MATGDLLFSRAFALLAAHEEVRAIELLAQASVALARGELAQRHDAYDASVSERCYLERCELKTARLFECACLLGEDEPQLGRFGAEIGLAFQLLDDVLDIAGPPERTGKARGTDLLDGTVTLPLILARAADHGIAAVDLRDLDDETAEALCDRVAASGALEQVRARGLDMVEAAKRRLESIAIDAERQELLALVADGVVERYA